MANPKIINYIIDSERLFTEMNKTLQTKIPPKSFFELVCVRETEESKYAKIVNTSQAFDFAVRMLIRQYAFYLEIYHPAQTARKEEKEFDFADMFADYNEHALSNAHRFMRLLAEQSLNLAKKIYLIMA